MTTERWTSRYEHLTFDDHPHGVLLITINRPETNNSANQRLHRELGWVWRDVDHDADVSVAVITGAGEAFCSGGEIDSMVTSDHPGSAAIDESIHEMAALVYGPVECRKPVISAINGVAMACGLAIALAADISIVGQNVPLLDGHQRVGLAAGDHAALLWPQNMSLAKARYYLLTGNSLSGSETERIGLVSLCVPDNEVLSAALAVADRIATGPQYAARWTKKALNAWVRQNSPIFELSLALESLSLHGADMHEFRAASAAGRRPQFPSVAE